MGLSQRPLEFRFNPQAQLAQGLVFAGLGRHTGSTYFHDSSLYKNHGTLTNMDPATDWVWNPDLNRWALDFNAASSQYIDCGNVLNTLTFPVSIAFFIRRRTSYSHQAIVSTDDGAVYAGLWISRDSSNKITANFGDGEGKLSGERITKTSAVSVPFQTWCHVLCVFRSATDISIFFDGVDAGGAYSGTGGAMVQTAGPLRIARFEALSRYGDDTLSEILIATTDLSPFVQRLTDRSNVMLDNLILQPHRRSFASAGGAPPSFAGSSRILGGSVI